jgi:hypothetical protein
MEVKEDGVFYEGCGGLIRNVTPFHLALAVTNEQVVSTYKILCISFDPSQVCAADSTHDGKF